MSDNEVKMGYGMGRISAGGLLLLLAVSACHPSPAIEPAFAGNGLDGYRVVVTVPNENPDVVKKEAANQLVNVCPNGFDVVHISRRQEIRTIPGNLVLNAVVACKNK